MPKGPITEIVNPGDGGGGGSTTLRWDLKEDGGWSIDGCPTPTPGVMPGDGSVCSNVGDRYIIDDCRPQGAGYRYSYMECIIPTPKPYYHRGTIQQDGFSIWSNMDYTSSSKTGIYGRIKETQSIVNNYWVLAYEDLSPYDERPKTVGVTGIWLEETHGGITLLRSASYVPRSEMVAPVVQQYLESGTRQLIGNQRKIILLQGGGGGGNAGNRTGFIATGGGGYGGGGGGLIVLRTSPDMTPLTISAGAGGAGGYWTDKNTQHDAVSGGKSEVVNDSTDKTIATAYGGASGAYGNGAEVGGGGSGGTSWLLDSSSLILAIDGAYGGKNRRNGLEVDAYSSTIATLGSTLLGGEWFSDWRARNLLKDKKGYNGHDEAGGYGGGGASPLGGANSAGTDIGDSYGSGGSGRHGTVTAIPMAGLDGKPGLVLVYY